MFGLDDLISGGVALLGQGAQNRWSARQAQKQMDFQKEMSSTAHQREVADLKKAGLNPLLSVNAGASSPSGAMAEGESPVGAGLSTAMQARQLRKSLEVMDADINEKNSRAALNTASLPVKGFAGDVAGAGRQLFDQWQKTVQSAIEAGDNYFERASDRQRLQHLKETERRARAAKAARLLQSARQARGVISDQPLAPTENFPKLPADSIPFLTRPRRP
ncbi:MAG: DNA pilot protein [Microviridae sp.]|nr:MAG: DNA pilot protein [Microviridae sp.]